MDSIILKPKSTIKNACKLLKEKKSGAAIIMTKNSLKGIFTEKDLVNIFADSNEFFVVEYIREACIKHLAVELPYSLHVEINKLDEEKDIISIASTVYLKKKSHLSIVVGKNGSMLVKISKMARINSENFFKKKVYLKIFVKYDPKWKNTNSILDSYS